MAYPNKKDFEPKTTEKGTKLYLMNLQGKAYMPVNQRLVWFREVHPAGSILTEAVKVTEQEAIFKATIAINNVIVATGFKRETPQGFADYIEKSETGAIGRALAVGGFGSQFDTGFDEGDRLADAPVEVISKGNGKKPEVSAAVGAGNTGGVGQEQPTSPSAATVDTTTPAPSSAKTGKTGLAEKAKNRADVNNLLSSVSRAIIAKKLYKVEEIRGYMQKQYGTDDKAKLDDNQATELLGYLDNVNTNGLSNGAMATA